MGNIAGDSAAFRDLALSHGALRQVLSQLNDTAKISMIRNATWALLNFFRGKPKPLFEHVSRIHFLPLLLSSQILWIFFIDLGAW